MDDKWSLRMARLEALITMGPRPSPQQPSFSPVKVPVPHQAPQGSLSQTPFIQSSVLSGQAGPASGPYGTQTSSQPMYRSSPLENLYPETYQKPVFQQPGLVASAVSTGPLQHSARDIMSPDQIEEGEVSEPDDQPDSDSGDKDKVLSEGGVDPYSRPGIFSNLQNRQPMDWSQVPTSGQSISFVTARELAL